MSHIGTNQRGSALIAVLLVLLGLSLAMAVAILHTVNRRPAEAAGPADLRSLELAQCNLDRLLARMDLPRDLSYIGDTSAVLNPGWEMSFIGRMDELRRLPEAGGPPKPLDSMPAFYPGTGQLLLTIRHKTNGDSLYFRNDRTGEVAAVPARGPFPADGHPVEVIRARGLNGDTTRILEVDVARSGPAGESLQPAGTPGMVKLGWRIISGE